MHLKVIKWLHLKYSHYKNVMEIMWHGKGVSNGMMEIILQYVSVSNKHVHFKLTEFLCQLYLHKVSINIENQSRVCLVFSINDSLRETEEHCH